jgi:beta-galactosidase/beta-glucuronidase
MGMDVVNSYTGFRTISKGVVDGVVRPLLNGEFIFMFGTLDQGYWPDGIYTPPNREAMVYDLEVLKSLGFNMLRKHVSHSTHPTWEKITWLNGKIKVETDLFYQACDQMGLMLIQDMPALRPLQDSVLSNCTVETILPDPVQQAEFDRQLEVLVNQHKSFPSIITWVRAKNFSTPVMSWGWISRRLSIMRGGVKWLQDTQNLVLPTESDNSVLHDWLTVRRDGMIVELGITA